MTAAILAISGVRCRNRTDQTKKTTRENMKRDSSMIVAGALRGREDAVRRVNNEVMHQDEDESMMEGRLGASL